MESIKEHIALLLDKIGVGIWEKDSVLSLALLSCVAGESIFLLGPPGTAKSLIARRLKEAFEERKSFEYLMSRFSTPDEIFGPVSISKLKNEDVYERCTEGFLPAATIVFLDEIWKAGPAIQNALLTAINEKIYQNGNQTMALPMKGLIAASNELPAEDEGLEALWDRFLVRVVSNCISNENTFYKMLRQKPVKVEVPLSLCITDGLYAQWQEQMEEVKVEDDILSCITHVRGKLQQAAKEENVHPFDYYVSDRRWKKIVHLLQASAFLNDRGSVDYSDLFLLYHTLWNRTETIPAILSMVTEALFFDVEKEIGKIEKEVEKNMNALPASPVQGDDQGFKVYNYFYIRLLNFPQGVCYFYMYDYKYLPRDKDTNAVFYWDDKQHAFFLRCFDASKPFSTSQIGYQVRQVKLRAFPGGLSVDGQPYAIEQDVRRKPAVQGNFSGADGQAERGFELDLVRKSLLFRMEGLKDSGNLFVSPDDLKLAKKHCAKLEKRLNDLEIKLINSQTNHYGGQS